MLSKISDRDLVAQGSGFPVSAATAHQPAPHRAEALEVEGAPECPRTQREATCLSHTGRVAVTGGAQKERQV